MEQTYKQLTKILSLKPNEINNYKYEFEGLPQQFLEKFLYAFSTNQQLQNQTDTLTKFIHYMADQRHCKLLPQLFIPLDGVKILPCSENKAYTFDVECRAYCLYGRAVSVLKRKGKQIQSERPYCCTQLQNTIFQLNQQGALPLSKNQSHEIDDILLNFSVSQDTIDPILLSNEVFSPFVPQPYALVLILPIKLPKPDNLINFLKDTLLHIYIQQVSLLNKIMYRQVFYKNTHIKGIYFIQQGQVESTGGRIVARGWMTNGKCRGQGIGWKFKVMPFMKSMAKNQHIWKQFLNDLTLNKEYPFKPSYILGLQQDLDIYELPDKKGKRRFRLPRIGHSSFDLGKLAQIQKMKHYDDRINDMTDYKEKLLFKKSGSYSLNRNIANVVQQYNQRSQRRMFFNRQETSKQMIRYPTTSLNSSSENILIMSVLKKLESLTELKESVQEEFKQRKDKIKISPAKLYQKSRVMKKRRYNK